MIQLDLIEQIIREASALMVRSGFSIKEKGSAENIVTTSDLAVQDYLTSRLSALLPGSGFLCEEEDAHDLSHEYVWIIDPIDGTANYARGIRECGICVGLRHYTNMELAVIYLPRTDELFTAERGKGAFLHHPHLPVKEARGSTSKQLHVSERPFSECIMFTALSLYHKEYARISSEVIYDVFMQCNDIRRFGSAASELCYLAKGVCELFFEYILSPWDFAAASLILEEAGGVLCDLEGNPLDHTKPSGILAANSQENLDRLIAIVKKKIK